METETLRDLASKSNDGVLRGHALWAADEIDRDAQIIATLRADLAKAVEGVEWYGEQARLCRLIHSGGDVGRNALSRDGGNRAQSLIKELRP